MCLTAVNAMNDPKDPTAVLVTFVGGPLHGTEQQLDSPEITLWQTLPDGQVVAYGRRLPVSAEQPSDTSAVRVVYAPVGMSDHAYIHLAELVFKTTQVTK
jgi:hypothetical protein